VHLIHSDVGLGAGSGLTGMDLTEEATDMKEVIKSSIVFDSINLYT
jgi:hypothetical protein